MIIQYMFRNINFEALTMLHWYSCMQMTFSVGQAAIEESRSYGSCWLFARNVKCHAYSSFERHHRRRSSTKHRTAQRVPSSSWPSMHTILIVVVLVVYLLCFLFVCLYSRFLFVHQGQQQRKTSYSALLTISINSECVHHDWINLSTYFGVCI